MEKKLEKPDLSVKFKDEDEYRHYYMSIILQRVRDMTPVFQQNYMKSLMKQYGIDTRYLPPNFRSSLKEDANADAKRTEGPAG